MLRKPNAIQPELFDEFTDSNLNPKQRIYRRIMRKRLPPHFLFTLSYENIIISIIVLIMLIIVSFSLGIERGKKLLDSRASLRSDAAVVEAREPALVEIKKPSLKKAVSDLPAREKEKAQPYIIQVATFKQKALAEKEMSRLRKLNYNPFSLSFGKFHLVFVGNYATGELAKKDLRELRKIYKDCFIKRR